MSRITTPATIDDAPEASQAVLRNVEKAIGMAPNLHRLVANSPAALQGYVGLSSALAGGALDSVIGERVALAVAEMNGCDYCLAAHSLIGKGAGLDEMEIEAARRGSSSDPRAAAALTFATQLVDKRGQVPAAAVDAVRAAGFSEAEVVEIVAHVALNTLTNYINEALGTEVDFPAAAALAA